ncbi:MAG: NUDIX domain-containing protein [Caldilineaceae bacterium]|nr:NUDIX domain-containing protein [Caldilineaceae bacterium]
MKTVQYTAAGGIVVHNRAVLLLDRKGRGEVRLPKGHVEEGESHTDAALRETMEEAGYADLRVVADLGSQVVKFDYNGKHFVRTEHYYLMQLESERQIPRNKKDAAQFAVLWVPLAEAAEKLTFAAEQAMVQRAIEALQA